MWFIFQDLLLVAPLANIFMCATFLLYVCTRATYVIAILLAMLYVILRFWSLNLTFFNLIYLRNWPSQILNHKINLWECWLQIFANLKLFRSFQIKLEGAVLLIQIFVNCGNVLLYALIVGSAFLTDVLTVGNYFIVHNVVNFINIF